MIAADPQPLPPLAGIPGLRIDAHPNKSPATATHAAEIVQPGNRSAAWSATRMVAVATATTADHKVSTEA
jgi:hypothetical protein